MKIVAITILREAADQGDEGIQAVYCVIRNRSLAVKKPWPKDMEQVCLQPYQFSCWNPNDKTRNKYFSDIEIERVEKLINEVTKDITNGATYYVNPNAVKLNPFDEPGMFIKTAAIKNHVFYKDKK